MTGPTEDQRREQVQEFWRVFAKSYGVQSIGAFDAVAAVEAACDVAVRQALDRLERLADDDPGDGLYDLIDKMREELGHA